MLWKDLGNTGSRWLPRVFRGVILTAALGLGMGRARASYDAAAPARPDIDPRPGRSFVIEEKDGVSWLCRPNGQRFFSLGVCCVDQGISRENFDPDNPGYGAWQEYPNGRSWAKTAVRRLASWGFTTVGAWSDFKTLREGSGSELAFTPVLHVGSAAGAPWWDMWDPRVVRRMEEVARDQIRLWRDDPRLIGYYSDNELGWWNATLFKTTLEQSWTSGQRRRLLELLRKTYHNSWAALVKDFEPENAANWEDLSRRGMLYLRPGGKGVHTMRAFLGVLAERYYSLMHEIIRKYDRRALILGDRYQSFYYPEVARASAPYVDAISSNLDAQWNDGTFSRFFLKTLHELTGKPVLVSEFYMAARENGSGNRNSHGIYPVVATQAERAAGFRATVEALLKTPSVIGADWFQYYDEPAHGRGDGENFDFGLVDIRDRPYEALTASASALLPAALQKRTRSRRLDASQGVPAAPNDPLGHFEPNLALKQWDRERGFIKPASDFPVADLYVCWDERTLYLGLCAQDIVEEAFYRNKIVPKTDRAEWIVTINGADQPIRARIGAGTEPIVNSPSVRVVNFSGLNANVRNVAAMGLPAKLFGKSRFKPGDTVNFASTLFGHCHADSVKWKGGFRLRADH